MAPTFLFKSNSVQSTHTLFFLAGRHYHDPPQDDATGVVYVESEGESEVCPTGHIAHTRSVVGVAGAL